MEKGYFINQRKMKANMQLLMKHKWVDKAGSRRPFKGKYSLKVQNGNMGLAHCALQRPKRDFKTFYLKYNN